MLYKLHVDLNRNITERYVVEVEATDPEEALDLTYQYFVDYPNGDDFLKSRLRDREATNSTEVLNVEFARDGIPLQDDLREGVFGDDDGNERA